MEKKHQQEEYVDFVVTARKYKTEAMKMQNRVVAPISGVVVELNVKEGDKITKNHLMVKIESK